MDPAAQQAIDAAAAVAMAATADPAALQARIDQAVNAAMAATVAAAPPVGLPPAAAVVTFSRSPAQATNSLIDYTTSEGMKIYTQATKGI